ncbi:MAG: dehydrogenase E1 component subunit alpha/beta [Capsulimonadaceae bacterium]
MNPSITHSERHLGEIDPIQVFRDMVLSRECDRRESILVRQGKGIFHVGGCGHEALAVISRHLEPGDSIYPYYRDRAISLARGYTLQMMAREFFGTRTSSSAGANLPGHYCSRELNIFPVSTPTASQCLPAAGAAWGIKLAGRTDLVVTTVGDAATRQGEFYEAVAFALQEKLPLLIVVEDNAFGISTRTAPMLPFHLDLFPGARHVDGRSVFSLHAATTDAVARARRGDGPTILWCEMDRLAPHTSSDDHTVYRSAEEIEAMQQRDPITLYRADLARLNLLTPAEADRICAESDALVDAAYADAMSEPAPAPLSTLSSLYGADSSRESKHSGKSFSLSARNDTTMVAEINRLFAERMATDPRIVLFGQDIEDPKGGVFGFTRGLSTQFPSRVFNSPLAEATIIGAGVGLAASGYRPVFELQFVDFISPGFNQLTSQAATVRWRSAGTWSCPLVLYAPYGAYLPSGGPWHSQSNESWFAHTPGIRVAVPSTTEDVVDLFLDAMATDDPSLILIPKHVFRVRQHFRQIAPLGFGKARVRRLGTHATIVCWGNCVSLALDAAGQAASAGIETEVIDLRTLVPCDWPAVWESVAKTGRLLVVQEDARTCGFGQAIISEVVAGPVPALAAAPVLLSRPDTHIPYHPDLEEALLPSIDDILRALRGMTGGRTWK